MYAPAGGLSAADHYLAEKVNTASPAELVGMLYDKAIVSLKRAKVFLAERDYEQASGRLRNASDIVLELRCILNHDAGELAGNLEQLYVWVTSRLLAATREPSAIDDALAVLEPIASAWRESCIQGAANGAGAPALARA